MTHADSRFFKKLDCFWDYLFYISLFLLVLHFFKVASSLFLISFLICFML
jgi:hypothetical protein